MQVSADKDGVLRVIDINGKVVYDRVAGVNVAGWSDQVTAHTELKTITESTGKITKTHGEKP